MGASEDISGAGMYVGQNVAAYVGILFVRTGGLLAAGC